MTSDSTHAPDTVHSTGVGHAQAGRSASDCVTGRPSHALKMSVKRTLGWAEFMAEKQARYEQLMEGADELPQHERDQLYLSVVRQMRAEGY